MTDKLRIYLVTDRKIAKQPFLKVIKEALKGGVKAIQLREKDLSSEEMYGLAKEIRNITEKKNALLIINDRIDIALAAGADGVHLGWQSMPVKEARRILGKKKLIGVSTHSLKDAVLAQKNGADFITFGTIYPTVSKEGLTDFKGPEAIKEIRKKIKIPLIAIGGIKEGNIKDVILKGADGVAIISAIMASEKPYEAAKGFVCKFESLNVENQNLKVKSKNL